MNQAISEERGLAKSVAGFLSGTMLSRISGFFRDVSMAFFFGVDASIAAFLVALRFAILLRRIFGEGALLNGFVPHFEEQRKIDPKRAARFFRDTFFSLFFLLILIIGSVEALLYFWLPGASITSANKEILQLMMFILPGVIFVCLFGICSGLLHCEKHFFISGVAPVAYNTIWIAAVWILGDKEPQMAAIGLSLSISFAFLFQWIITLPKTVTFLRKHLPWKELFQCKLFGPEMRKMLSSLSLGVLGVTAVQINTAVDSIFARMASLEGPAYLTYAIHLQQLPLALFGVAIASALLPSLSRAKDLNQSKSLLEYAISNSMFVILPGTAAIFTLGCASINLIYGHGHFDSAAAGETTWCLWGYGIGLAPMVLILLISPAFYAAKDYWTPTRCSLMSIAVSLILNAIFISVLKWGPASLAFSTSFSAALNVWLLARGLRLKMGIYFSPPLIQSIAKTSFYALIAGISTLWASSFLSDPTIALFMGEPAVWKRHFSEQLFDFSILFAVFSSIFLLLTFLNRKSVRYSV